jgi:hypothetical protein
MKKIGLIIIVIGTVTAAVTGFSFFTRNKVVDVGDIEISTNKRHDVEWSPILGLVTAAVGAGIYFVAARRTS